METVTVLKNEGRLVTRSVALGKGGEGCWWCYRKLGSRLEGWKVRFGQIIG